MSTGIEVFVTTKAISPFRFGCAIATLAAWAEEVRVGRVRRLVVWDIGADPYLYKVVKGVGIASRIAEWNRRGSEGSQRERHLWSAKAATDDVFVTTDDDLALVPAPLVLDGDQDPTKWNWVDHVRAVMQERPKLAMASALPSPGGLDPTVTEAMIRRLHPDGVLPEPDVQRFLSTLRLPGTDPEVWRVHNVGGMRVVRRSAVMGADLPPLDPDVGGGYDSTLGEHFRKQGMWSGYFRRLQVVHLGYMRSGVWSNLL